MHWMNVKLADNFQIREYSWPCLFHIMGYDAIMSYYIYIFIICIYRHAPSTVTLIQQHKMTFNRTLVAYEISKVNFRAEKNSCQYVRRDLINLKISIHEKKVFLRVQWKSQPPPTERAYNVQKFFISISIRTYDTTETRNLCAIKVIC
jgi:hypothetical protein